MISTIRAMTKLCIVIAALAAFLPIAPSYADSTTYASATGTDSVCTLAQPCADVVSATQVASNAAGAGVARVICLAPAAPSSLGWTVRDDNQTLEIDCPLGFLAFLEFVGNGNIGRVRGLTFMKSGFANSVSFSGNGTLILEDCTFVDDSLGAAIVIEPNGPLNLVIKNSRIANNASGVILKPAAGGSIKATLDHVTITGNTGGGIRTDSTSGVVNLDITDSEISNNSGNGINAVAGADQNIVSIERSVIARNGVAGVQANGANAGVLVQTTLFDQNASGATSIVSGGRISTYGNNSIVGSAGSGFNGTAGLQ